MSVRDIQLHLDDLYGYELSAQTISNITEKVIEKANEWQFRPLEALCEEDAQLALTEFNDLWGKKYPNITASWQTHWAELATFFKYQKKDQS